MLEAVGKSAFTSPGIGSADRWRPFVPAVIFVGIRALGVAVLAVMGPAGLADRLTAWDGVWYLRIAANGYDLGAIVDAQGHPNPFTTRAFFPGYPFLIDALSRATGLGLVAAALTVSAGGGLFAAYGLARLGRIVRGGSPRAGYLLVGLFAAAPMGIVLSMTYTEALFCALAVWTLIGVLERRWELAAVCCAMAGLVRSTALALVVTVVLAALLALRTDRWRAGFALVLAPSGLLGYLWWTGLRVRPDAGFADQLRTWSELEWQGWSTKFDGGLATLRFIGATLSTNTVMSLLTVAVIASTLVLFGISLWRKVEWPLLAYAAIVLVMCLGTSGLMHAKARFLVPAFTVLVPVAIGLANRRRGTAVLTVGGAAILSAWFGGYALDVWSYAI
ncbi:hypothetical protein FPZ12_032895 [Amycolatopsis acidicola]|uniref:Glycosyltransferase RgtA/B/C/D-like domain-containing protein n=1 Tax=Amycolatopsis acidicola TaxID=2596893 RepID=A0A5N0UVL3_9PSEU|nr:hypothetical protein [Amycolatopsis acidicola]KAA9154048.1 hypothetical protein FPZ12_032895 [Amycolatopsis acidicola]